MTTREMIKRARKEHGTEKVNEALFDRLAMVLGAARDSKEPERADSLHEQARNIVDDLNYKG